MHEKGISSVNQHTNILLNWPFDFVQTVKTSFLILPTFFFCSFLVRMPKNFPLRHKSRRLTIAETSWRHCTASPSPAGKRCTGTFVQLVFGNTAFRNFPTEVFQNFLLRSYTNNSDFVFHLEQQKQVTFTTITFTSRVFILSCIGRYSVPLSVIRLFITPKWLRKCDIMN